jgi:hypothetical protein
MIYLINNRVKEEMSSLAKHAQENVWTLDNLLLQKRGKKGPPGDDPKYVRTLWDSVRVVFTHTQQPSFLTRHMSVSAHSDGDEIPHPVVIQEIMKMLGFLGTIEKCTVFEESILGGGLCINIVEKID